MLSPLRFQQSDISGEPALSGTEIGSPTPGGSLYRRVIARSTAHRGLRSSSVLVGLMALLLLSGCGRLSPWRAVGAGAAIWQVQLDGDVQSEISAGILGEPISLDGTLDLDGTEDSPILNATLQLPFVHLEGRYTRVEFDGATTLDSTIDFLGETFTVGTVVDSDIEFEIASIESKWTLLKTPAAPFVPEVGLGLVLGAVGVDLEAAVDSDFGSVSDRIRGATPVVGGIASVNWPLGDTFRVFADAQVDGMSISYDEYEGDLLEVRARIGVGFDFIILGVGYQFYDIDFEEDDYTIDVVADGLLFFGEIGF